MSPGCARGPAVPHRGSRWHVEWVLVTVLGLVVELVLVIALGRQVTARDEVTGHVDLPG